MFHMAAFAIILSFFSNRKTATVWSIRLLATTVKKRGILFYISNTAGERDKLVLAGKVEFHLDNLLAEEKAEEMIVVCNSGEVYRNGENPPQWILKPC